MDSSTYTVVPADVGKQIKVIVSLEVGGGAEGPFTSDAVTVEYTAATPGGPGPGEVILLSRGGTSTASLASRLGQAFKVGQVFGTSDKPLGLAGPVW